MNQPVAKRGALAGLEAAAGRMRQGRAVDGHRLRGSAVHFAALVYRLSYAVMGGGNRTMMGMFCLGHLGSRCVVKSRSVCHGEQARLETRQDDERQRERHAQKAQPRELSVESSHAHIFRTNRVPVSTDEVFALPGSAQRRGAVPSRAPFTFLTVSR
ncbi:MAG: hypothetical protein RIB55_08450 [Nitratireductor sp.]